MKFMAIYVVLVFVPSFDLKFNHRFKNVECGSSSRTIEKQFCYIKAYNRKYPLLNHGFTLKRRVPKGKVWIKLNQNSQIMTIFIFWQLFFATYRKDNSESYVKVLYFPDIEWCRVVDGLRTLPLFEILLNEAKTMGEDLINFCFRIGDIKVTNVSLSNSSFVSKWPAGDFKSVFKFFDDDDDNISNMTFYSHITH